MGMSDKTRSVIECENVWKTYGDGEVLHALQDVSFRVRSGERVAIMGPSGCGKSTLLNLIGCLDRPTRGTVLIDNRDTSRMGEHTLAGLRNKKIGFIFQFFYLIPTLDALHNVMMPMIFAGAEDNEERARRLLGLVGLDNRARHRPFQLSGGQRQRVAIARAMANEPEIILADEPTGNLDSRTGNEVMNYLLDLNREKGVTLVIVTHDRFIAEHAERIIKLKDGKIEKTEMVKRAKN